MGCCRGSGGFHPTPRVRPAAMTSPCASIEGASDAVLVEVLSDGTLVPKTPYNSMLSMTRTLTVLGCAGHGADSLRELELAVTEALTDPVRARKFWARLVGRLVTVGAVRQALSASA